MGSLITDIGTAMFGTGLLPYLETLRGKYELGDRTALLNVLLVCSLMDDNIPEWARVALIKAVEAVALGKVKDLNEVFGFRPVGQKTRRKFAQLHGQEATIVEALARHRTDPTKGRSGGNFRAYGGLEDVSQALKISRPSVEVIYKKHKKWLLPLKPGDPFGYGIVQMSMLQVLRTRKRDALSDDQWDFPYRLQEVV
jgi:hypothetical protein